MGVGLKPIHTSLHGLNSSVQAYFEFHTIYYLLLLLEQWKGGIQPIHLILRLKIITFACKHNRKWTLSKKRGGGEASPPLPSLFLRACSTCDFRETFLVVYFRWTNTMKVILEDTLKHLPSQTPVPYKIALTFVSVSI